ncbi:carbohydrate-binding protein [Planosporangium sp. 12N6]|uniref:carbohydrate-binding protein n=1 Tax=Planosporangium spinosum TaxID=3402278 RepID=UPI003CEC519A
MLARRAAVGATLFVATAVAALLTTPASAGTRPAPVDHPAAAGRPAAVAPRATCQQQSFLEGDHYSAVQIARLARDAGFSGNDWVTSVAVAEAESAGWTRARLINTDCSVDRGLWQINSYWHGEVSDACAFDPPCNARGTHTIWAAGGWTQWTTYNNGAYRSHLAEAQAAVDQVNGGGGGGGGGGTGGGSWQPNTAYTAGQQVTYGGHTYRCLQSHTSLPGWEPPNVPALWQYLS